MVVIEWFAGMPEAEHTLILDVVMKDSTEVQGTSTQHESFPTPGS